MRIVAISDQHGRFNYGSLPSGDVLLMAGDSFQSNSRSIQFGEFHNIIAQINSNKEPFVSFKKVFLIAGNHDYLFEKVDHRNFRSGKLEYLQGDYSVFQGLKFYGFPWQPRFYDWAFNVDRNSSEMDKLLKDIPEDIDVLISHGPPFGDNDFVPFSGKYVGCEQMVERIESLNNLKLHVYGHVHAGYGVKEKIRPDGSSWISANVSVCNERYESVNKPMVFDI